MHAEVCLTFAGRHGHNPYKDGGLVDRVGLHAWRNRRRSQALARGHSAARVPPALVHVIARSSPFSGADDVQRMSSTEPNVHVVQSPKSEASFFSLGDFEYHMTAAKRRAQPVLAQALMSASSTQGLTSVPLSPRQDQRSPGKQRLVKSGISRV